jgi:hypothetical protein
VGGGLQQEAVTPAEVVAIPEVGQREGAPARTQDKVKAETTAETMAGMVAGATGGKGGYDHEHLKAGLSARGARDEVFCGS